MIQVTLIIDLTLVIPVLCFVHFAPASTAVEDLVPEASLLSAEQKDCEHSSPSLTKIEIRLGGKRATFVGAHG